MVAPVKVEGQAFYPAVSRVLVCLFEKDVKFQLVSSLDMTKGEHKKPELLRTQSFGRALAFEDEGKRLTDSTAICRHVSVKYANQGNKDLYGTNSVERGLIDYWLKYEEENFDQPSSELVWQLVLAPAMKFKQEGLMRLRSFAEQKKQALIRQNEENLKKVLDVYETRLGENRYLAGDKFTLADLSHLPNTHYLVHGTEDRGKLFTSKKNVARWWGEISSRDSWKQVVAMQK